MTRLSSAVLMLFALVFASALAIADDEATVLNRADTHRQAEEWEEALAIYQGFLLDHPKHARVPEVRYHAALCLVETDEPEGAAELLDSFLTEHAASEWAEKALPRLGELYRDQEQFERARDVWAAFLAKHFKSEDRGRVFEMQINLFVKNKKDFDAGFRECERWVKEKSDPDATAQARFMGAYCLTKLHRDKEADSWINSHFAEESAHESALRAVIRIASDLSNQRDDAALKALDGFWAEYEDVVESERTDILQKLCGVLTLGGKYDRARQLVVEELKIPAARSEEVTETLFEVLKEIVNEANDLDIKESLTQLIAPGIPALTRAHAIETLVDELREDDQAEKAELVLRRLVADDTSPFIRVRAGTKLASFLADELEDRHAAVRVLKELLPKTTRRDLGAKLREAIKEYDEGDGAN